MALDKFIILTTDGLGEKTPLQQTTGVIDGGRVIATGANGKLDSSLLPDGVGADIVVAPTIENLQAGDFVNMFVDTGILKVRKADASLGFAKNADGFVKDNVSIGANASVYQTGYNDDLSGLVIGNYYYLSNITAGKVTVDIPAEGTNHIRQRLGKAIATTTLAVKIEEPILRA